MVTPLKDRKKVVLLRSAWRRGLAAFLRQFHLTFCDTFLSRTHLIYQASAADVLKQEIQEIPGLSFREVHCWEEFSEPVQRRLLADQASLSWGSVSWFNRGWRLWAGEFGDQLATLCWWRSPEQSRDFFQSIPGDAELMWQSTTMPEFRGRGLFTVQRLHLLRYRIEDGVGQFFVCCESYNMTGRRNLPSQGFHLIGHTTYSKITKRRTWHPVAK